MPGVLSLDVGALRIAIRRGVEMGSLEDESYWSCGITVLDGLARMEAVQLRMACDVMESALEW